MKYCPHPDLRRSKRRLWEWPFSVVLRVRPYRCSLCHQRIWRYRGRIWLDLGVVAVLGLGLWIWLQGTRVRAEDDLAALAQPVPAPPVLSEAPALPQAQDASASAVEINSGVAPEVSSQAASSEPVAQDQFVLNEVRWLSERRQFRLLVEFEGAALKPRVYQLESPPRLVVDLPGHWQVRAEQLVPQSARSDMVAKVRLGDHAEELRVVLDLRNADKVATRIKQAAGRLEVKLNQGS